MRSKESEQVPEVDSIKDAVLAVLASGRRRSFESLEEELADRLHLTPQQKAYRREGSSTTLFANRVEKARAQLRKEGLVEYPERGKVRLTEAGKARLAEGASCSTVESPEVPKPPEVPKRHLDEVAPSEVGEPYHPGSYGVQLPDAKVAPGRKRNSPNLPLILAVVGLMLCFSGVLAWAGVLCGAAALVLWFRARRDGSARSPLAPKATLGLGIASVALGAVVAVGTLAGGPAAQMPPSSVADQANKPTVAVNDEATKEAAEKKADAARKQAEQDAAEAAKRQEAQKAEKQKAEEAAEKQKAEEAAKQKAAEEAAAAEEAEKQRLAEEEAAAAAAAAAAAEKEAAAAAAAANSGSGGGDTVYITNTGEKYHENGCQYLKKSKKAISKSDAEAQGYTPCSRCNP